MKKITKSTFLVAAVIGMLACSSNAINLGGVNSQTFILKESAEADARFGANYGEVSFKKEVKKRVEPKRGVVLHSDDLSLTKPKIGTQVAYSDKDHDGNNDHISIRYTAAVHSLDVEATWTRAMYDADGNNFSYMLEDTYAVTKAYRGITSGGVVTYATNELDDFGNKPFNYYVVYSLFDVPLQSYGTYFLDASLQLSKGGESIVSKVGALRIDNTSSFSYERGTNSYLSFEYDAVSNTYSVNGANSDATEIVVPGYYNNGNGRYKVNELVDGAFEDYDSLEYIDIPCLDTIGADAFKNTNAKILSRDNHAGANWNSEWNSGNNSVAWEYAGFHGEKDGLIYSLSKDELGRPYSTVIGTTNDLESDVVVSNFNGVSTKKIGEYAFYANDTIESIALPDSVVEICDDAFRGSTIATIDTNHVVDIGRRAFQGCRQLTYGFTCGESLRTIGVNCFAYSSIRKLILNDGFESIGTEAFYELRAGACSLYVPSSVTSLGGYLFNASYGYIFLESAAIEDITGTGYRTGGNEVVIYGESDMELHTVNGISYFQSTVNEVSYATIISAETEQGTKTLTIPETINGAIVRDYKNGFVQPYGNETLDELIIEARFTKIRSSAFQGLRAKQIVLPDSITKIEMWGFAWSKLETVRVPDSVTAIESQVFYECNNLKSVYLPSSIQTIDSDIFGGCSKVKVYCEDSENKWGSEWNSSGVPVYWGVTPAEFDALGD